jgi:uncharacterized protein
MNGKARRRSVTALGRFPERGHYDFETVAAILDAALVCHVGVLAENRPIVIPTIYARIERNLYLHGSPVARWMRSSSESTPICITVSIIDALVLARSAYQHSLNYRSVVVPGQARPVLDEAEKLTALRAIVEHACPGRWQDVRPPTTSELNATLVLCVPIAEASAKIRTGPPSDFDFDMHNNTWAGLIPFHTVRGTPVSAPDLAAEIPVPAYCLER